MEASHRRDACGPGTYISGAGEGECADTGQAGTGGIFCGDHPSSYSSGHDVYQKVSKIL